MYPTIRKSVRVQVDTLRVVVPVDYGDEDMPYDFPFRDDDLWSVDIDLLTGCIKGWPSGQKGGFNMKVLDGGSYTLLYENKIVAELHDAYVPCDIGIGGGDYVEVEIGVDGDIEGWPTQLDLSAFEREQE